MGLITALSATGLAAGLAVTGVSVAAASAPASAASADITLPSGSILAQRVVKICERVPNLETRLPKAQARLSGNADTKGSIAWLKAKEAAQQKKGHTRVVNRLDKVLKRREARLAKLPTVEANLAKAKTECTSLNLGGSTTSTPSSTPSATSSTS